MTVWLIIRSALALLLCVVVVIFAVSHAGVPPVSAIGTVIGDQAAPGVVVPTPVAYSQVRPRRTHPVAASGSPVATSTPAPATASPTPARPSPTSKAVVIPSGLNSSSFPNVPGYIFFTDPHHNLQFITGQHAHKQFTGDGASVAPALSPNGHLLAWVLFKRNYSDLEVTALRFGRGGSVMALPATTLTQDAAPPPAVQPNQPYGYDPRYDLWANKPSWLPDGQHLLYISDRPGFNINNAADADMAVWMQGITDTMTNAVKLSTPEVGTGGHDSPAWRPGDPATFVYVNYDYTNPSDGSQPARQGVIEVAGVVTGTGVITAPSDLTPQGVTEYQPAWSPDGRHIAFARDNVTHTGSNLLVMPFHAPGFLNDYNHAVTAVAGSPYAVQPFWSPDGRYLGYLTGGSGDFQLVIRRVYYGRTLSFGPPISILQAGAVSADYRPTWGMSRTQD